MTDGEGIKGGDWEIPGVAKKKRRKEDSIA